MPKLFSIQVWGEKKKEEIKLGFILRLGLLWCVCVMLDYEYMRIMPCCVGLYIPTGPLLWRNRSGNSNGIRPTSEVSSEKPGPTGPALQLQLHPLQQLEQRRDLQQLVPLIFWRTKAPRIDKADVTGQMSHVLNMVYFTPWCYLELWGQRHV